MVFGLPSSVALRTTPIVIVTKPIGFIAVLLQKIVEVDRRWQLKPNAKVGW
jgi:hypothetical protein